MQSKISKDDSKELFITKWHTSMQEIPEEDWNHLLGEQDIPFYKWNWLNELEKSKSVCNETGWQPLHMSIWKNKQIVGLAPLYLKNHSYGEFIFDNLFLQLSQELEVRYYPKIIGMSPFSPIEGYKFFISQKENQDEITLLIMKNIDQFAIKNNILSCNFLYVDPNWSEVAKKFNYHSWINQQSLWQHSGEKNFSDYLTKFNANQRRNIKREQRSIRSSGVNISTIEGEQINQEIMASMYQFYKLHCSRWGIWGSKYLSRSFFKGLANSNQRDRIVLFSAHRGNPYDPLAMSLCIRNKEALWGRYWGFKEKINYLHFEVCYYSPIKWAIEQGIKKFDPGAGGSHKKRRGFNAQARISMHKWYDKRMESLMKNWYQKANSFMIQEINASNNEAPLKDSFKKL